MSSLLTGDGARRYLVDGVEHMERIVRPLLGPQGRTVVIGSMLDKASPEIAFKAGIASRRVYALEDAHLNLGAMLMRHVVWRVHDQTGDGGAMAGVIAAALIRNGITAISSGVNPGDLRKGIQSALVPLMQHLRESTLNIDDHTTLVRLLALYLGDPELGALVAEAVVSVGEEGFVWVQDGYGPNSRVDFPDGMQFTNGWLPVDLGNGTATRQGIADPAVLVSRTAIVSPEALSPVLEACARDHGGRLFIVAPEISPEVVNYILANRRAQFINEVVAVGLPGTNPQETDSVEDIAAFTGARCVRLDGSDELGGFSASDLGTARSAWAERARFLIRGGHGTRSAIEGQVARLRAFLTDPHLSQEAHRVLTQRIARLRNRTAVISVADSLGLGQSHMRDTVRSAVLTGTSMLRDGAVAGGGTALVRSAHHLDLLASGQEATTARSMHVLARSLEEPMRAILQNAGREDSAAVVARTALSNPTETFDVLDGDFVDVVSSGITDALATLETAVAAAVSCAGTVLEAEVLVPSSGRLGDLRP